MGLCGNFTDWTASLARTSSSAALFGKRKRLGPPFSFSAITIKYNETLLTYNKRLSKYRQRLAWAIYHSRRENIIFACFYCIVFLRRDWEVMSKTRASCFITGSKHLETIKALGLRPRAFICFSVFGTPDETLALVFDILNENTITQKPVTRYIHKLYFNTNVNVTTKLMSSC